MTKPYIIARLKRDGHQELADQVQAGTLSARQAGLQAGFVKPESGLTALNRAWKKASAEERAAFMQDAGQWSASLAMTSWTNRVLRRTVRSLTPVAALASAE